MLRIVSTIMMFATGMIIANTGEHMIPCAAAVTLAICGTAIATWSFFKE